MKNKLADAVQRLEDISEAEGPRKDQALLLYSAYRLVRFIVSRPLWVIRLFVGSRKLAVYNVTFSKKRVKVMLVKSMAELAIENRADHQGAVQYVWQQARAEVALDPDTYVGVKVPDLHVWRNVNGNGAYTVGIKWMRDAYPHERKIVGTNLLRDFAVETIGDIAGL